MKNILKINVIAVFCLVIDQFSKIVITSKMSVYETISIIKDFFSITYVQNEGAAWSILNGKSLLLALFAIFIIIMINVLIYKQDKISKLELICYGTLTGGIIGNMLDRIVYGYVIDFLDFKIFSYDYPIFNFADILICLSAVLLIIITFKKGDKNEISSNN